MISRRVLSTVFVGCLFVFPFSACAPSRPCVTPAAAEDDTFRGLVDAYFEAKFAYSPTLATSQGVHAHDAEIEDRSAQRIQARIAELHGFRARFSKLDRARLSFDDAIDAEVIANDTEADLLDLEVLAVWQKNPMIYAGLPGEGIDVLMKREFAPRAERLRALTARLRGIPAVFVAARANVREPPREFTDLAIRMARGSIGFFEKSVADWAHEAAAGDTSAKASFDEANAAVVTSMREFVTWLEKDLLPRSRGSYAIGEGHFRAKLKFEEMIDEPIDRLLARGEAQLAKDRAAFFETARKIDARAEPALVVKRVSDDHPTAEDLVPSIKRSLEAARQFLVAKDLITIPSEVRPRVEETPPYARSGSFASMDTPGPYESKATEAFYYVTPVEADWDVKHRDEHLRGFNPFSVASINVHEAYPGHYLQFLYAPRFPTKTRKLLAASSNAEGWAHYAEQMMVEQGFGDGDPRIRLTQLQEALLRDCRYVVGIKLHTQGLSVEDGARIFVEQGFFEPANAFEEARRGTYNPTYLYYTLGKLEIQKLRDDYMAQSHASLKSFHDAFVSQGSLPLPLVRRILLR